MITWKAYAWAYPRHTCVGGKDIKSVLCHVMAAENCFHPLSTSHCSDQALSITINTNLRGLPRVQWRHKYWRMCSAGGSAACAVSTRINTVTINIKFARKFVYQIDFEKPNIRIPGKFSVIYRLHSITIKCVYWITFASPTITTTNIQPKKN